MYHSQWMLFGKHVYACLHIILLFFLNKNSQELDERSFIMNKTVKNENELKKEEIKIYKDDCGSVKYKCMHDCIGGSAWLSTAE